ncbi:MAG: protein kinase [Ktedonobacteraceae bacterium]|nr:protein kinase [Ktedonobacteraceae bacterium]
MSESSSLSRLAGTVLGNYRLEQLIERHRWGPVFLAKDKKGMACTVRFIGTPTPEKQDGPVTGDRIIFLGRFQQEANRIATLNHPHILPLLDYGNYQGIPYLVYPYTRFPSLRTLLAQNIPTDIASVGRYLDQIGSTLEYAHEHAVLHRNLSTRCIYLQNNGQMVVEEFGLLYIHDLSKESARPAADVGRAGYTYDGSSETSAPEQLLGKPIDASADVYALGVVLYRMLVGKPPFNGRTPQEVVQQHLYTQMPALTKYRADLPPELDGVVARALAKEPAQRYQHPAALVRAYFQVALPGETPRLTSVFAGMPHAGKPPVAAEAPGWSVHVPQHTAHAAFNQQMRENRKSVSRRRFFVIAGAAGGVIVVAAAVFGGNILNRTATANTSGNASPPANNGNATIKSATQPPRTQPTAQGGGAGNNASVLARTGDVPLNSAKKFAIAGQKNPGLLIHLPDGRFVAFDSTCTHQGCVVDYNAGNRLLLCPCHEAVFDPARDAAVVQGPAPAPLKSIKITVHPDGTITG